MDIFREVGLIGRDDEMRRFRSLVGAFGNVLIYGQPGHGKTAFYLASFECLRQDKRTCIYLPHDTSRKAFISIMQQLHGVLPSGLCPPRYIFEELPMRVRNDYENGKNVEWKNLTQTLSRYNMEIWLNDIIIPSLVFNAKHFVNQNTKLLLWVDDLLRRQELIDLVKELAGLCQLVATVNKGDKNKKKIAPLMALFPRFNLLNMAPIDTSDCKLIVEKWLEQHKAVRFTDERVRSSFITHVATSSGGVPATIEHLLLTAEAIDTMVSRDTVRKITTDIEVKYVSMLSFFLLTLLVMTVFRTIGRQVGNSEWVVIGAFAGIFLVMIMMFRFQLEKEDKK
ncbi:MAG: hypothetical protein BWK79_04915 [Beggiatoa sp. IS2]|nr:MAG: hypothetical protein BWK79_04915 [Beggiatoa sp. IS2]